MDIFQTSAAVLTLVSGCSYINHKWLKMPMSVGVMTSALLFSLFIIGLHALGIDISHLPNMVAGNINFSKIVLEGLLSFLLFSGSIQVDLSKLNKYRNLIAVLALLGTLGSMLLTGLLLSTMGGWLGFTLPELYYYLFGALISPTDPIAILAMLKKITGLKDLGAKIAGESLFNDGIAIVLFTVVLTMINEPMQATVDNALLVFARQAGGGILYGAIIGWITHYLVDSTDDHNLEVLLTLTLVTAGYSVALAMGISGPLAMVVAGLIIGQYMRQKNKEGKATEFHKTDYLNTFWELMDELLTAVLFVMIGLEVLVMPLNILSIELGLAAIPAVLIARWVSVWAFTRFFSKETAFSNMEISLLTWGGLRGGLAVAMALAIPPNPYRETIIVMTYIVVTFSILVQGITFPRLLAKAFPSNAPAEIN